MYFMIGKRSQGDVNPLIISKLSVSLIDFVIVRNIITCRYKEKPFASPDRVAVKYDFWLGFV